jgi:hypothetical protein
MTCHQHRCCRRSAASAADVAAPVDYIVVAATEANVTEGIATMLRGAGVAVERHELGLRLAARGTNYKAALAHLWGTLAPAARSGVRVASIPIAADAVVFQRALFAARPLEAFRACTAAVATTFAADAGSAPLLGNVFKGDSLE